MTSSAAQPERPAPTGFPAIIARGDVLEALERSLASDANTETVGVLVGNAAPSTNFVLITASLAGRAAGDDMDTAFEDGELESLAELVHSVYPGQRIVGWYRSHPGLGVYMSADDARVHGTSFAHSWQVAYIFDPSSSQRGFFGWSSGELVRVPSWEVTNSAYAASAEPAVRPGTEAVVDEPVTQDIAPIDEPQTEGDYVESSEAPIPQQSDPEYAVPFAAPIPYADISPEPQPSGKNRNKALAAVVVGVIAAIIVMAIVLNSGDDDEDATVSTDSVPGEVVDSSSPATEPEAVVTTTQPEVTSTSAAESTSSTAAASINTFPPTPTSVQAPATRVGAAATACEETGPGEYEPLADCFVPLANGNILVFTSGSLRCVDPADRVLAAEAQQFTVGIDGDPLVIVADGTLLPKCSDLTYVRNIIAGGAETLDGLCGSSGTQINEATARCFGQNPTTGAIGAIVRGTANQSALVAECFSSSGESERTELTWSNEDVSTLWRVDATLFDVAANQFAANASREAVNGTGTASFACT